MRSKLLLKEKFTDDDQNLVEMVAWKVLVSAKYPNGVRYRLVFIPAEMNRPAVLYDNHYPKGHHKHIDGTEEEYEFQNLDQVQQDFQEDVWLWKRKRSGNG
jgi:hypothetical protein